MSYFREFKFGDLSSIRLAPQEARDKINEALLEGKEVEWEFSSFGDPGKDWQQVRVDKQPVPGTHSEGY